MNTNSYYRNNKQYRNGAQAYHEGMSYDDMIDIMLSFSDSEDADAYRNGYNNASYDKFTGKYTHDAV